MNKIFLSVIIALLAIGTPILAQQKGPIVDEIIAKVDDYVILKSDLEKSYRQFSQQNNVSGEKAKCRVLENLIVNKLMVAKAEIDSVVVTEEEVASTLDRKMQYFISQIGGVEQIEEYYGKTIEEFKDELADQEREQLLVQKMQQEITSNISVTPADVRDFFNNIPVDSLPLFSTEFVVAQIVKEPEVGQNQKQRALQKANEIRSQIMDGPDLTSDFNNFTLEINKDNTLEVSTPKGNFIGNWTLSDNFYFITFAIESDLEEVQRLNDQWIISIHEDNGLKLLNSDMENQTSFVLAQTGKKQNLLRINPESITQEWEIVNANGTGASFAAMAKKYSDDPGSARDGGSLGFQNRGNLVPEFEATALNMKPGEVSKPVLSQFGYHIIQLVERRGNEYHSRHILIKLNSSELDIESAEHNLDSLRTIILNDSITFEKAAKEYSDDKQTAASGGYILDDNQSRRISADDIDPTLYFTLDTMELNDISPPLRYKTPDGSEMVRIVYLKDIIPPHKANLNDDYQKIQLAALNEKKARVMNEWFEEAQKEVFVNIDNDYMHCNILNRQGNALGKR